MRMVSAKRFAKMKFKELDFDGVWLDSLGKIEVGSKILVYGDSGGGKTEFCVQLAKYMSGFGRVVYVSAEQGISSSLQRSWVRNDVQNTDAKLVSERDFKMILNLFKKRIKPKAVLLDSIDYMKMSTDDYKLLESLTKKTVLVLVSWAEGKKPKTQAAKDMEYMVDVKIHVNKYVAYPKSRFSRNVPYVIWEDEAKKHHGWMNR